MTPSQRLEQWFDGGRVVRPSADVPNYVDLVRAMARLAGCETVPSAGGAAALCERIGPADHYVFVLVDALGMELVERLPVESFLRGNVAATLQSLFPSTTATAMTTLATGLWPAEHAVPGWWTYLPRRGRGVVSLRCRERMTDRPMEQFGLAIEDLCPIPSVWPDIRRELLSIVPKDIVHSTYSRYARGQTPAAGYETLGEALFLASETVRRADRPSYVYVYLPELDSLMHKQGTAHEKVDRLLGVLDTALAAMTDRLGGRARVVISADHGQVDVPPERRFVLPADDPLRARLVCPPTGEPTVPVFHVIEGEQSAFAAEFDERFGEHFVLLPTAEAERMRLFGPGALSPRMRRRLGSFVGVAAEPAVFYIAPCDTGAKNVGVHGGLRAAEMFVPLILA